MQLTAEKKFYPSFAADEFSCMVRAKNSNCLILGGYKYVKVVRYMSGSFYDIFNFENIHRSYISDIFLLGNLVYTLCKDDEYIGTLEFENEL